MTPSKLDLEIHRGTTFELELVSQVKKYLFDPAIHNKPADLRRTHQENLEHHGFVYEYVDFAALYPEAVLEVMRPWRKNQDGPREPLLSLSLADGDIELTSRSVKVGISAGDTREIEWEEGHYELVLTTAAGKVDGLVYGEIVVKGNK